MMKLNRNLLDVMRQRPRHSRPVNDLGILDDRTIREWADMPRARRSVRTERD